MKTENGNEIEENIFENTEHKTYNDFMQSTEEEHSFTPNSNDGFWPGYNPSQNVVQPVAVKTEKPEKPKKKKKEKATFSFASMIVVAVVCAIVSGVCTSFVFMNVSNGSSTDVSSVVSGTASTTQKNVTVIQTDTENMIEEIAEKVSPSVVGIRTTTEVSYYFFGTSDSTSEGTGIVYTSDGYIITNYHVISDAVENGGSISVYLADDSETGIEAKVTGYDVSSDLAVIKIDKTGLTAIEIGDSDDVKVGQTAIAIGNPGGLEYMGSVSCGIISGLNRSIQIENTGEYVNLIQTDAAINPGNSGGALVNSNGFLIGVNSAKLASDNFEGMGFAIPSNTVVSICQRIISNVDVPQAYLGVDISQYYTSDRLNMMGYPSGVVVESVTADSPADDAGLQRGDIITEFNGVAVTSLAYYNSEKAKCSPGDTVKLTVYRQSRLYTVEVTLGTANQ